MTHLRIVIIAMLFSWLGSDVFAQTTLYTQNFTSVNAGKLPTSGSAQDGWLVNGTNAIYAGSYEHRWGVGSGGTNAISGKSLGLSFYNGANLYGAFGAQYTDCGIDSRADLAAFRPISTAGYSNIQVTFDWKGYGESYLGAWVDYGQVGYSTTGGAPFTWITTGGTLNGLYHRQTTGTTTGATVTFPSSCDNAANFTLAFRVVLDECGGTSPVFVIDNVVVKGTPLSSCVAGTASGPAFVVTGGTANLTLSGNIGTTIQWQASPNGSTGWASVSGGTGATTASYTTAALANGTYYYRAMVTDGGACTQYSNVITTLVAASPPYCSGAGSGNAYSNNHLESIGFHEWTDPNPGNYSNNYMDYTDTVANGYATVVAGQYHHLSALIRANGTGVNGTTFAYWIDWNGDGTFTNTAFSGGGERMDNVFYTSTAGNTYASYFTVPSTSSGTVRVRMRVVRGNIGNLDPCNAYTNSQTKDFTVKILPSIGNQVCNGVNGNADNVLTNNTIDKVNISRVYLYNPSGTVLDNNGQFFGVQAGATVTMYNYSNFMGSYSNGLKLEANTSYTMEIEHSGYTTAAGLFIDYNGDGDFADADELVARLSDPNANPYVFNFTVPSNVVDGKQVTMRVRLRYDANGNLGNTINSCNNISDGLGLYSEVEDYRTTLVVPSLTCAAVTNLAAAIGSPANGTQHHLNVTWTGLSGATGYDLEYSTSGGAPWNTSLGTVTGTSYDFNAGDNPNTPYTFRIRAKDGTQTCTYATMSTPRYTAADVPATPVLSNVGSTIDVTLPAETPVANPAITTYSIKDDNTGLYVQANGSLGATEVFRTKAQWGTVTVTGLTANTQHCFVAKARNNDGHEVGGTGATISAAQGFDNSGTLSTAGGSGPTNTWWSPSSCGSGGLSWNASNGCSGGAVGQQTTTPFCMLRSPQTNCTGLNTVVMTFDISNSYFAANTTDQVNFNMWAPTAASPTGTYIDASKVNGVSTEILYFTVARSCQSITVEFDLSTVTDKSAIMFYFNTYRPGSSSNQYFMWVDNVKINEAAQTACATTTNCTAGTWTGLGGDNDWNNAANWSCNTIPTASIDVVIPSGVSTYPILATIAGNPVTGYTRNLTVAAGANVNINAGGNTVQVNGNLAYNGTANIGGGALRLTNAASHTVSGSFTIGTLTVEAATTLTGTANVTEALNLVAGALNTSGGVLTLKSNATTTAYINDFTGGYTGTLTGNVTVERFVSNTVGGFHYVGAPVGNTNIADWSNEFSTAGPNNVFVTPQASCNPNGLEQGSAYGGLFDYRESNVTTCYQSGWRVRSSGPLGATEGYAGVIPNNTTINLTGTANTGNVNSPSLSRTVTNGTSTQGMHMVSNPYPSALDWYQVSAANSDLDGTAYLWLTSGGYQGTYQPINAITPGSSFIGSSQGFFVEALANGAVVNYTNTMRVAGNNNFARQAQAFDSRLILEVAGNGYNDRTIVAFGTDFTHGYDREFDGKKMLSKGGIMTLYTTTNSSYPRQATNALPNDRSVKVVPVGFAAGANGTFTFTATDLGTFPVGTFIYLEDKQTGTFTNLMATPDYTFTGRGNDAEDRFLLHFIPGIEWSVASATCVGNDGSLVVDLGTSEMGGTIITWDTYEITDATGNEVVAGTNANGTINLDQLSPGTYTVILEHDGYTVTQDITVAGAVLVDAAAVVSDNTVLEGEIISFGNNSIGATTYTWNFGDGNTSTDANPAYSYDEEGVYTVTLTATNGTCTDVFTQTIIVSKQGPTGINTVADHSGIRIYGFERTVTVRFDNWNDKQVTLDLYDLTGRKVIDTRTLSTTQAQHQILVSDVVTGYYFVRVQGASGVAVERIFLGE